MDQRLKWNQTPQKSEGHQQGWGRPKWQLLLQREMRHFAPDCATSLSGGRDSGSTKYLLQVDIVLTFGSGVQGKRHGRHRVNTGCHSQVPLGRGIKMNVVFPVNPFSPFYLRKPDKSATDAFASGSSRNL